MLAEIQPQAPRNCLPDRRPSPVLGLKDDTKTFSGKTRPLISFSHTDMVGNWRYISKDRSNYQGVRARWRDTALNKDMMVTMGDGDKIFILRHSYPDEQQAKAAAKAKLAALDRGGASFSLKTDGNPGAGVESELIVSGFHPDIVSAPWVINRVEHCLNNSGFTTFIEAEIEKGV